MRHYLHLLAFIAAESPPEFFVVNKMPPTFTVTNRIAPEVARPKGVTFRNGDFHGSHSCPNCGRQQFTIYSGAKGRNHYHRCPYDGTIWQH